MNEVLKTIKSRRSIRRYLSEQIKDEELDILLESAIYAPTWGNDQPWYFTVIQNREFIENMNLEAKKAIVQDIELVNHINAESKKTSDDLPDFRDKFAKLGSSESFNIFYEAPTVIVVSGKKGTTSSFADCCAAIQNMLIAAESLEIGSCWIGLARFFFENPENVEKLNLPDNYEPYYAVTLGYKAAPNNKAPERNMNVVDYIK